MLHILSRTKLLLPIFIMLLLPSVSFSNNVECFNRLQEYYKGEVLINYLDRGKKLTISTLSKSGESTVYSNTGSLSIDGLRCTTDTGKEKQTSMDYTRKLLSQLVAEKDTLKKGTRKRQKINLTLLSCERVHLDNRKGPIGLTGSKSSMIETTDGEDAAKKFKAIEKKRTRQSN